MRVLRVVLGLIGARLFRQVIRAVHLFDEVSCGCLCLVGNSQRVCTHVGDKTDCAHSRDVDTFVEFLRCLHRAARLEGVAAACLLLQRGSRERRRRLLLALGLFQPGHGEFRALKAFQQLVSLFLAGNRELLAVHFSQFCRKRSL